MSAGRFAPLLMCLAAAAAAQEGEGLAGRRLDLSLPSIPALTALDVSPTTVARPGTVNELSTALSNGISPSGDIQAGTAMELSPAKLAAEAMVDQELAEALARTLGPLQVSFASDAALQGTSTLQRLAVGGRYGLWRYDPTVDTDFRRCLAAALPAPTPVGPGEEPFAPSQAVEQELPTLDGCRAIFKAAHLATDGVELAYVLVVSAVDSSALGDFRPSRHTGWISASKAFNFFKAPPAEATDRKYHALIEAVTTEGTPEAKAVRNATGLEVTVYGRVDSDAIGSGAGAGAWKMTAFGAARVLWIQESVGLFVEGGLRAKDVTQQAGAVAYEVPVGIGGELHLATGAWLGAFFGADALSGNVWVLSNLRWALSEQRPFH